MFAPFYFQSLMGKGYFPQQLPPLFTTQPFAARSPSVLNTYGALKGKKDWTRGEHFSVARMGHARRSITIPNPVVQAHVADLIAKNWIEISVHYSQSKLSVSQPDLLLSPEERATSIASLSDLHEKRLIISGGYKWFLKTDISRFFPTLYTHTIPWALHSKKMAKAQIGDPALLGNVIDKTLICSQQGQTIGIPIGPDTSHIIAEIVATSVDCEIFERLGGWPPGYRHVDDFFLCFDDRQKAELVLAHIERALKEFELEINVGKTRIAEMADLREDDWVHSIRSFSFEASNVEQQKDQIHAFFSLMFELSRRHADENVAKSALRRAASTVIHPAAWPLFESYLLRTGQAHNNCMQTLLQIAATYSTNGYPLNREAFGRFCSTMIRDHASSEHHSEVAWALWMAKELKLSLSEQAIEAVQVMHSAVCALLLLHLEDENLLSKKIDRDFWDKRLDGAAMRGPYWLLAYEGIRLNWIKVGEEQAIRDDPMFKVLDQHDISFVDKGATLKAFFKPKDPSKKLDMEWLALDASKFFEIEWEFDESVEEYVD